MFMSILPWIPANSTIRKECDVHPHDEVEKANLYHAFDIGSTEIEILNWLHAQVLLFKPKLILETGGFEGAGTVALAHACKMNGFGKVISIEINPKQCVKIESMLEENNLREYAEVECYDSIKYLNITNHVFDMGFFDSETEIRAKECEICLDRNILRNLAVFHDTSPHRLAHLTPIHIQQKYRSDVFELARRHHFSVTDFEWSRGFMAIWLR